MSVSATDIVCLSDSGHEAIVVEHAEPDAKWLAQQKQPADAIFWTVYRLRGGTDIIADPLYEPVREASYDDFLLAAEHCSEEDRRTLNELFPDYAEDTVKTTKAKR